MIKRKKHGSLAGLYALLAILTLVAGTPAFQGLALGIVLWLLIFVLGLIDWESVREYLQKLLSRNDDDDDDGSGSDYNYLPPFM